MQQNTNCVSKTASSNAAGLKLQSKRRNRVETPSMSSKGTAAAQSRRRYASVRRTYFSNRLENTAPASSGKPEPGRPTFKTHAPTRLQGTSDATYKTPQRETAAGVAKRTSRLSSTNFTCGPSATRSLDARVRVRGSSMTECSDSIQRASTSPSSTIHFILSSAPRSSLVKSPSRHAFVSASREPYSIAVEWTFGLSAWKRTFCSCELNDCWSVFHVVDLPDPAAPKTKTQCRDSIKTPSCSTRLRKTGSGQSPAACAALEMLLATRGSKKTTFGNKSSSVASAPWRSSS
mmetsp:Transcript_24949/g.83835  ORF Transcript_24949/g.83835 Transcript_24949/m.83835 type:complete len:290 (-) Transcript_24949:1952-2821(-)